MIFLSLVIQPQTSHLKEELAHTKNERDILAKEVRALKQLIVTQTQEIEDLKEKKAKYKAFCLPLKKGEEESKLQGNETVPSSYSLNEKGGGEGREGGREREGEMEREMEELRRELEVRDIQIFKLKSERERERLHRKRNDSLLFRIEDDLNRSAPPPSSSFLSPPHTSPNIDPTNTSSLSSSSLPSTSSSSSPSPSLDPSPSLSEVMVCQTLELEAMRDELEEVKKKHFYFVGWSIKNQLAERRKFCNVKIDLLYECARDMPVEQVLSLSLSLSLSLYLSIYLSSHYDCRWISSPFSFYIFLSTSSLLPLFIHLVSFTFFSPCKVTILTFLLPFFFSAVGGMDTLSDGKERPLIYTAADSCDGLKKKCEEKGREGKGRRGEEGNEKAMIVNVLTFSFCSHFNCAIFTFRFYHLQFSSYDHLGGCGGVLLGSVVFQ